MDRKKISSTIDLDVSRSQALNKDDYKWVDTFKSHLLIIRFKKKNLLLTYQSISISEKKISKMLTFKMAIFSARFNFEITMIIYKWNKAEINEKGNVHSMIF